MSVSHGGRSIEGSEGYWGKFPDPSTPAFRAGLARNMARRRSAGDRYCIGYFSDNELSWGDDTSLAVAALALAGRPAGQAGLRGRPARPSTATIADLNAAWGTTHASWDALLQDRSAPPADGPPPTCAPST